MSWSEETFYRLGCDFPGCGAQYDDGEYTWWAQKGDAKDQARDDGFFGAGWHFEIVGDEPFDFEKGRAFCAQHTPMFSNDDERLELALPGENGLVLVEVEQ